MKTSIFILLFVLVSSMAVAQWPSDPALNIKLTNLTGEQVIPKIARSPNGNYYIGYFTLENGNYGVRLQLLSSQGNVLWQDNGIVVSTHPSMTWLTDWDMTADADNHAILVWQDVRTGNNNIVAYRISPDGQFVWGPDGILLSNNMDFNVSPKVAALPDGDVVVAWQSTNVIYRQRLNPAGQKLWGENGITLGGTGTYSWPQLLATGQSEVFMKYFIDTGPSWSPTRKMYVRKFNSQGADVWLGAAELFNLGNITAWTQILPMIPDGNGGFYITWHDYSFNGNAATPRLGHVSSSGQLGLGVNGVPLSLLHASNQFYPEPALLDGDQHIYTFWLEQNMDQTLWGVFGQKTTPGGTMLWGETGKEIIPVTTQYVRPLHVEAESDGIVLFYEHAYSTTQSSLRAIRINHQGELVWPQEAIISSAVSTKGKVVFAPYSGGQWVLAWEDNRTGDTEIFAQNMKNDGTLGPVPPTGVNKPDSRPQLVSIAPNPANMNSRILFNRSFEGSINLKVMDASGRTLISKQLDNKTLGSLTLGSLFDGRLSASGVYYLSATTDQAIQTIRFLFH
ncbi:MAG TPA: T9SS type A sorting domain-containing protein [Bacteroidales bacterium]|nr:T9SS type A sorting domain-containing protein [Bacteroidales bacterium]